MRFSLTSFASFTLGTLGTLLFCFAVSGCSGADPSTVESEPAVPVPVDNAAPPQTDETTLSITATGKRSHFGADGRDDTPMDVLADGRGYRAGAYASSCGACHSVAVNNPLYVGNGAAGTNPLHHHK